MHGLMQKIFGYLDMKLFTSGGGLQNNEANCLKGKASKNRVKMKAYLYLQAFATSSLARDPETPHLCVPS